MKRSTARPVQRLSLPHLRHHTRLSQLPNQSLLWPILTKWSRPIPPAANLATCQWPISHYYHHSIGSGSRQLIIQVSSGTLKAIPAFVQSTSWPKWMRRTFIRHKCLWAGEYLDQVNENSRHVLDATVQEATLTTVEASSTPAPQNPVPQA
ncbi:hypothetical protein QBC32DRAFT_337797 [Pseudoneurospora amorphoporcata]|uniref:Uncharacterized protein n=1 Tax=Pseudoneurospora amorphoporcata TaxID=241081 RepID=A0AAN6P1L7_9PEZI|nr:hypothetical protein QBC32DRAFT_337797 [Pseudoneurospora amorphoporcata]